MRLLQRMAISVVMTLVTLLVAVPTQAAGWLRVESPNFIVYSDVTEAQTREYIQKLESFQYISDLFYIDLGDAPLPQQDKTVFYLMRYVNDYRIVRPDTKPNSFNPYYVCEEGDQFFSTKEVNTNNESAMGGELIQGLDLDLGYMLFSLNRTRLLQHFSYRPPAWLANGLNWYMMTTIIDENRVIIGRPEPRIAYAYTYGERETDITGGGYLSDFADIIAEKPVAERKEKALTLQNWVITHYMMSDKDRRAKLKAFLDVYATKSKPPLEAFISTTGITPETFSTVLKDYKTKGIPATAYTLPSLEQTKVAITVTKLPDYKEPLPLLNAATLTCPDAEYGAKLLKRIRKQAPLSPNDDLTQMAHARAEILFGAPSVALPILTARLAADPKNFEAQYWLGRLYLQLAQNGPQPDKAKAYVNARRELGKAYQLNDNSALVLYNYAQANENKPGFPDDNALNAAKMAYELTHGRYNTYYIRLLILRGDYTAASALIADLIPRIKDPECLKLLTSLRDSITAKQPVETVIKQVDAYEVWEDTHKES
ncbi:tetratricopeptide repeat protein [Asticcacaulis machinosus]|uniref:Tetratricopeptide repeat-containing protein n=1 Tax=Asticcacaulis machinosus TaxID=2984211 RepID=A0ABT5HG48_9CAUL|nr:hypothetical protein [Asticcacaulis machinosus]MDC7675229.1 hypothetical protein [Asticcacaulis machinosus]